MEKAGDRWWPLMAAVYLIVAKKRVFGMTPLPIAWKAPRKAVSIVGAKPAMLGSLQGRYRRTPHGR